MRGVKLDRGYDAFEHLRLSIFAKQDDLFVMLAAYFDDSGSSVNEKVAAVAGYLATADQWHQFNQR